MPSKRAFTLIELLVVISIISLLSSIVLSSLSGAKQKAVIVTALQQLNQYATSLESYKIDKGVFPRTSSPITYYCLGDYVGNTCGAGGGIQEDQILNNSLRSYLNLATLPAIGNGQKIDFGGGSYFIGANYFCSQGQTPLCANNANIVIRLPGANIPCPNLPNAVDSYSYSHDAGGVSYTNCTITIQ